MFEPWQLAAMEEAGLMDTKESHINRVANQLNRSPNSVIGNAEFRRACYSTGVDPDSFTARDLDWIQRKLK